MKNRILTNSTRNIRKAFPRFLSLLIISLLGVFAFSGLQATAPDMINSLDNYLDSQNTYDLKILSTLGVTNNDIAELKKIDGIKDVLGTYSKDVLLDINNEEIIINVSSLSNTINNPLLIEGKLPQSNNDIVVEENFLKKNNCQIGESLMLNEKTYTICGTVDSSLFFNNSDMSQNRGSTSIGAGIINYYSFVNESAFEQDYYNAIYITIDNAIEQTTSSKKYNDVVDKVKEKINEKKSILESNRYNEIYTSLENEIIQKCQPTTDELASAKSSLDSTKRDLDNLLISINSAKQSLNQALLSYGIQEENLDQEIENCHDEDMLLVLNELKNTSKSIKQNTFIYSNGIDMYESSLLQYELKKSLYDQEMASAYEKLEEIDKPVYYIYDRTNYATYAEYIDDTNSIKNLSLIFPVVFFSIAVLISLISMNRLVEADRNEIGTLKSLGFSNRQIMFKYLMFSTIATLLGGIIGSALGIIIIPKLIFSIYSILFTLPRFIIGLNLLTTLLGFLISFACVCGATVFTVYKVLREKPSELMRPKSPKLGKRILLEKVKFFWKKLKFSQKITIRNLFRYKKRAIITIIGITGCTALMLCGFGIKDSIVDIPTAQYGDVFKFDGMAYINGNINNESFSSSKITSTAKIQNISASLDGYSVNLFVSESNNDLEKIVNLENNKLEKDKIIITEKLASLLKISPGDKVKIKDINNNNYEYEVSSIIHNYIEHYAFLDKEAFQSSGQKFQANVVYFNTVEMTDDEKTALTSDLLTNDEIISVSFISTLIDKASNMLKSLDKVVIILIVLASLLSFVVLYNLSNININERKRELATLKVLGFYPNEVDGYITKENIILTLIGIALGLVIGIFLTNMVVGTVEIEKARFIRHIKGWSYLYSAVMALCFTLVVNVFTHFTLKKIDMIESLKSVE